MLNAKQHFGLQGGSFPGGRNLNGQKNAIHNLCGPSCEYELWKVEKKKPSPDGTNKNFRYEKYPQSLI